LYLGLGASALCFVTWNFAVKVLGAVKTSAYIYLGPVVTIITSAVVLHERITWITLAGTALTLLGLFISENKLRLKSRTEMEKGAALPVLESYTVSAVENTKIDT